ncbi:efflux RND transporter periplasmic adaptor subunit [Rhizobium alvei]|uniref:Efflux RND transporter periplasmic adaptor subunit n=1 Tax=Rhizobium alvei TaxID=1132659 RepID=A0ABT8YTI3_9HYPH|nr:efflux RND transporter periplasmic adaptor subunit [Rhizobium alvei]MDO6967077.1 efflux RND transporter periplasmic adaptor subunit [Rhizobium alvei]
MRSKTNKILILASAMLAASVFPALSEEAAKPATQKTEQSFPAIRVTAAKVRNLTDRIIVTGSIEAVEEVYVQPQIDGMRIETLAADVGDKVTAGQVVATLSRDTLLLQKSQLEANRAKALAMGAQLEAQLAEVKANADESKRQATRAETLAAKGTIATSQAEQLRAAATAAEARIKSSEQALAANKADVNVVDAQIRDIDLKLSRAEVKTPVSGVISARNARIGAIAAGAGQPLFTVIRDDAVELKADIPEGDLLRLAPGQSASIALAGGAVKIVGKVRSIDPTVDATTRLGKVNIAVDDADKARVGMYASAEIVISKRDVLSLPLTAVTTEKGQPVVRKVIDGKVTMAPVTTGVQDGDFIEIAEGLKAEDMVVEKAGAFVRDGDRVTPVSDEKTASN